MFNFSILQWRSQYVCLKGAVFDRRPKGCTWGSSIFWSRFLYYSCDQSLYSSDICKLCLLGLTVTYMVIKCLVGLKVVRQFTLRAVPPEKVRVVRLWPCLPNRFRRHWLLAAASCRAQCRVLSLSDCRYSLNPLSQTRIDWVGRYRIRRTFKLSYA